MSNISYLAVRFPKCRVGSRHCKPLSLSCIHCDNVTHISTRTFLLYCCLSWIVCAPENTSIWRKSRFPNDTWQKGKFYTDSIYNGECNAGITGPLVFLRKTICDAKPTCCGWTFDLKGMFWLWPLCSCAFGRKCTSPFCSYSILVARRATLLV